MNHQRKLLAYGMGVAAIACGLVACKSILATDAFIDLQIVQVQVLSGDCSVPGSKTSLQRYEGVLDLDLPDAFNNPPVFHPYYLPVLVANNMDSVGGSKATEMNNITLKYFSIELSAPGVTWNSSCPAKFSTEEITILLEPGATAGASMNIITPAHSQCLQPQVPSASLWVTAKVTAVGRHGGTSIESAPFTYSVAVCKGCLQTDYTDSTLVAYAYPADYPACASLTGTNPIKGDACLPPGQDATILCCGMTSLVNGIAQNTARCPGVFTGTTATATSTSTSTSTATGAGP